jgi:hypothetical protein
MKDWVGGQRPVALDGAALLITVETLVELLVIAWRTELTLGLRAVLMLCVGSKLLLVALARRVSAGAVLGLLLFEATSVVVALGATSAPLAARLLLGANALAAMVLLGASAHAFPAPRLDRRWDA